MRMKISRLLILLALLLTAGFTYAQESEEEESPSLDNGSISSQFDYVSKKSGNYRADGVRYEVVREANLYKLRKNVLDSVAAFNKRAAELNSTISEHET